MSQTTPLPFTPTEQVILDKLDLLQKTLQSRLDQDEEPYLATEVCEILRINRRTLERKIKEGKIKASNHGKLIYIPRAELRRYLSTDQLAS
jgi:excisionase family DNA binding protein